MGAHQYLNQWLNLMVKGWPKLKTQTNLGRIRSESDETQWRYIVTNMYHETKGRTVVLHNLWVGWDLAACFASAAGGLVCSKNGTSGQVGWGGLAEHCCCILPSAAAPGLLITFSVALFCIAATIATLGYLLLRHWARCETAPVPQIEKGHCRGVVGPLARRDLIRR